MRRRGIVALMGACVLGCLLGVGSLALGAEASTSTFDQKMVIWYEQQQGDVKNAGIDQTDGNHIEVLDDGTIVMASPYNYTRSNPTAGTLLRSFNVQAFNSDARGCTSCHTLEDAMINGNYYHINIFLNGYHDRMSANTCLTCHTADWCVSGWGEFKDLVHSVHNTNELFWAMGPTCESCHYIDADGTYLMWDDVKYDVMVGIADVAADGAEVSFDWNQDQLTDRDHMWTKGMRLDLSEYFFDSDVEEGTVAAEWTIAVTGEVENPFVMTLAELEAQFGTVTEIIPFACDLLGDGDPLVAQAQVEGIPLAKILEYAQLKDSAYSIRPVADDGYGYELCLESVLADDALLAVRMNGDAIYPEQGYPVRFMAKNQSAGAMTKRCCEIKIGNNADAPSSSGGRTAPGMGVLSAISGQVFEAGQDIVLEGYSYAFTTAVTKVEFSFDQGATWTTFDTPGATGDRWVYWTLDLGGQFTEVGAYCVQIRSTSVDADGNSYESGVASFMFNVLPAEEIAAILAA